MNLHEVRFFVNSLGSIHSIQEAFCLQNRQRLINSCFYFPRRCLLSKEFVKPADSKRKRDCQFAFAPSKIVIFMALSAKKIHPFLCWRKNKSRRPSFTRKMDDGMERARESERLHHSVVHEDEVVLIPPCTIARSLSVYRSPTIVGVTVKIDPVPRP